MAKRLDGSISKPLERGERGGDMKIRAQLLVVAAFVLGLAATAAAQPGTVFLQGRGGSLIGRHRQPTIELEPHQPTRSLSVLTG